MRYTRTVRVVDRYIGSVVCFFCTLLHAFRPKPKDRKVKNILVIELVEMGASVMAYSSLRYIKKHIPDANIFVLCTESTKEPWMLLDCVARENVFALDNRNFGTLVVSIFKQTRTLSKRDIDLIIDFELFTRISSVISFLIRAKLRAGFYGYTMGGLYRGNFLDVKCNFNQNMHIAKNLLALTLSALDKNPRYYNWEGPIPNNEIVVPEYRSDASIKKEVEKKLATALKEHAKKPSGARRGESGDGAVHRGTVTATQGPRNDADEVFWHALILVAPTVGKMLPMRDYPKEQYVEVIHRLLKKYPKHVVVLVGTTEHKGVTEYIRAQVNDHRCVDFAGETASLRELLELFLMGDILIANDSGNPHFAAMTGLKTVALYGPETPFMYGPLGKAVCLYDYFHSSPSITSYNHKNPPSDSNESLRSISADRVVKTVQLVMEGNAKYGTVNNEIPYVL